MTIRETFNARIELEFRKAGIVGKYTMHPNITQTLAPSIDFELDKDQFIYAIMDGNDWYDRIYIEWFTDWIVAN